MTPIELFDLCDDLEVPRIPYSNCEATWARWFAEGKQTCIHVDGYVSVDYPDAKEEYITVREGMVTDTSVKDSRNVDFDVYFLITKIQASSYNLYFLTFKDDQQLISGITTNE